MEKKFISLALKNSLFYFILIGISSLLIAASMYFISSKIIIAYSREQLNHSSEVVDLKFKTFLDQVRHDIEFLVHSPFLEDFVLEENLHLKAELKSKMAKEFHSLISSREAYGQIRFIGIENNGKELIRTDRKDGMAYIFSEKDLQEKGSTNYFKESIQLPKDSIYFSVIDLNKEYGQISKPEMPTLRAACPLYANNTLFGILVINADLKNVFADLRKLAGPGFNLYVIDNAGYYLVHPDSSRSFGFEYQVKAGFEDDFKLNLTVLDSNLLQSKSYPGLYGDQYFIIRDLEYPRKNYKLYTMVTSSEEKILFPIEEWRGKSILITVLIILVFLFFAFIWMRRQVKGLQLITESMGSLPEDLNTNEILVDRNDEIGILAKTFNQMKFTIQNNLKNLAEAKEEAIQANIAKEEFLENMSHEMRNPLHTILGMTDILERSQPKEEQLPIIKTLKFSSNNLLSLVNDVLDFSKLREGKIILKEEHVMLFELCEEVIKSYRYDTLTKKIQLEFVYPQEIKSLHILSDSLRLNQILSNLISNAIKFTKQGGRVSLSIDLVRQNAHEIELHFMVIDTGMGIEESNIQKIVERFNTSEELDMNTRIQGAGLGLPIVVQLLKLFNSKLNIQSKLQQGSTFSFQIDFKKVDVSLKEKPSQRNPPNMSNLNLLCIDDDQQVLMMYDYLFNNKVKLLKSVDSLETLSNLEAKVTFDLLIADYHINDELFYKKIDQLTSRLNEGCLKILITGTHNIADIMIQSKHFFDLILQKPVTATNLENEIYELIRLNDWELPNMSSIFEDYDYQVEKLIPALKLLMIEWNDMSDRILLAMRIKKSEQFESVLHKMVNTLKRFHMYKTMERLNQIHENLSKDQMQDAEIEELDYLLNLFKHYFKSQFMVLNQQGL
ncbi:MAG: ATP-binding protein [Bacteroidota bacterium]|nr:ATP-binding protein [Bacteroidota bacterium]